MLTQLGHAVLKRAIQGNDGGNDDNGPQYDIPAWSGLVVLVNMIIFIPVYLYISYTLSKVYPVFAMVEDEKPPAYEPVQLDDDLPGGEQTRQNPPKPIPGDSTAVSSSIRAMSRMLRANGGFKALFRGFFCLLAQRVMTSFLVLVFLGVLGFAFSPIATLLASLTLVQFSTAWVHIIITRRSELHFWKRLPPFKRTFNATWKPVVLYWAASEVADWLPTLLAKLIGLSLPSFDLDQPTRVAVYNGSDMAKSVVVLVVAVMSTIFIVIPARVVLHRVQASLLPPDADTIIPFDRTFDGKVDPVVVSGMGYVTMGDAWSTFSTAAWRRLVSLYVKITLITFGAIAAMLLIAIPEGFIIAMFSSKVDAGGEL